METGILGAGLWRLRSNEPGRSGGIRAVRGAFNETEVVTTLKWVSGDGGRADEDEGEGGLVRLKCEWRFTRWVTGFDPKCTSFGHSTAF